MFKKASALLTMAAFLLFAVSCSTWRTREINTTADYPADGRKILSVVMASGEVVDFSKSNPGRLVGNEIVGERVVVRKRAGIDGPFVLASYRAFERVSIPLSDVRLLRYKETNAVATIAVVMLTFTTVMLVLWPSFLLAKTE